jgi:hypothetical protein
LTVGVALGVCSSFWSAPSRCGKWGSMWEVWSWASVRRERENSGSAEGEPGNCGLVIPCPAVCRGVEWLEDFGGTAFHCQGSFEVLRTLWVVSSVFVRAARGAFQDGFVWAPVQAVRAGTSGAGVMIAFAFGREMSVLLALVAY